MSQSPNQSDRTLTDADVEAIVAKGEEVILGRFYKNLGKGLWSLFWKAALVAIVAIAAYGASKGH
jgi:hypothetical protein